MSTAEWIANRDMFRQDGLLSWRILSLRPGRLFQGLRLQSLFWDRSVTVLLGLRFAASIGLLVISDTASACVALCMLVATSWFLTVRSWLGGDGADQMGQIVTFGTLLMAAGTAIGQPRLSFAGTLLVGGQLMISYFFAGLAKLLSPEWRRGQAPVGIMGTHSYGHALGARAMCASPTLNAYFCWAVMLSETLFPLWILLPRTAYCITLLGFFLFHVGAAYFMGLNTFVWAFAAACPSAMLLNEVVIASLRSP